MAGFQDDLLRDRELRGYQANDDLSRFERSNVGSLVEADRGLSEQLTALGRVADRSDEEANVATAEESALRSTDLDQEQFQRRIRSLGATDRQKRGAKKQFSLARELSRASAAGSARRRSVSGAKAATRASGGFADILFSQRLDAESRLARRFTDRQIEEIDRRSRKKAGKFNLLGLAAGIGASIFLPGIGTAVGAGLIAGSK